MDFKIGVEIELIVNRSDLELLLTKNNIEFKYYEKQRKNEDDCLVLRSERSLFNPNGLELNFPSSYSFEEISSVLQLVQSLGATFNKKCALHIHVSWPDITEQAVAKVREYYIANQNAIIEETKQQALYVNLNLKVDGTNYKKRCTNLNSFAAFLKYGTVEHRIYKSTIDTTKLLFAINQTKTIIENALKDEKRS